MHQSGMSDLVTLVVGLVVSMLMGVLQYIVVVVESSTIYCGTLKFPLLPWLKALTAVSKGFYRPAKENRQWLAMA